MFDDLARYNDAVTEYTFNVGRNRPNQAWILSPYDTWERNPFFTGDPAESVFDPEQFGDIATGYQEDVGASVEESYKAVIEYARMCLKESLNKKPVQFTNFDDDIPF